MIETKQPADFGAFFSELFKRFGLKSPAFFQILQWAGILAASAGYLPVFLAKMDIVPGVRFSGYLEVILQVAGIVTWLVSKLPVQQPPTEDGVRQPKAQALPFTSKMESIQSNKSSNI